MLYWVECAAVGGTAVTGGEVVLVVLVTVGIVRGPEYVGVRRNGRLAEVE